MPFESAADGLVEAGRLSDVVVGGGGGSGTVVTPLVRAKVVHSAMQPMSSRCACAITPCAGVGGGTFGWNQFR